MASLGIFYGSTTGNTERMARRVAALLGDRVGLIKDVKVATAQDIASCDRLILGTSTWDEGHLQEDWAEFVKVLGSVDLAGKKVAIFGLGDQQYFPSFFCDSVGSLRDLVRSKGAEVIGAWPTDGYEFESSKAVEGGMFSGLILDEDNQPSLSEERTKKWCELLVQAL